MNKEFILKNYDVYIYGFPVAHFIGKNKNEVRMKTYNSYCSYDNSCTFKDFLKLKPLIIEVERPTPDIFGKEIEVQGDRAYGVKRQGNQIYFVWPNESQILMSHELDVDLCFD